MNGIDFSPYYRMLDPQYWQQTQQAFDEMALRKARMNALAPGLTGNAQRDEYMRQVAAQEQGQKQLAQQQQNMKSLSEAGQTLRGLVSTFGRDYVVNNWGAFSKLHPLLEKANPQDITREGGYVARDEQGNVLGHFVMPPGGDKPIFVKAQRPGEERSLTIEQLTAKALEEKLGRKPTAAETLEQLQGNKIALQADRNLTTEQLTARSLEETLGRKPTATEIKNQLQKDKREQMREGRAIIRQYSGGGQAAVTREVPEFAEWSDEDKKWWYDNTIATGQRPNFGMGYAAAKNRAQYDRGLAQYARGQGLTGAAAGAEKSAFVAEGRALADITKRAELIKTFTNRIDANIDIIENIRKKMGSNYPRFVNVPINKLRSSLGEGDYLALQQALLSTSNEVAKVESGSLGIAGATEGSRQEWGKIHDPNLSYSDLMKVLNMSKRLGRTAASTMESQKSDIKRRMKGSGARIVSDSRHSNDPLGIRRKGSSSTKADPLGIRR